MVNCMENDDSPKKLLLHICCAPCSAGVVPELNEKYRVTGFFYNPNIDNGAEYELRRDEMERFAKVLGIPLIEGKYDPESWREAVRGLEDEPERGKRCEVCFRMRLLETARIADREGFDFFCTTLTLSPLKNAGMINRTGNEIRENFLASYLSSDFKKKDGFKKSMERSKEHNLYRQNYCGCAFSKVESKRRTGSDREDNR